MSHIIGTYPFIVGDRSFVSLMEDMQLFPCPMLIDMTLTRHLIKIFFFNIIHFVFLTPLYPPLFHSTNCLVRDNLD